MTGLLKIRENFRKTYVSYGTYIDPILHFIVIFTSLSILNANIGAMELLENPIVVIILSIVGAFLPLKYIVMLLLVAIVAHASAMYIEIGALVFALILVMYLLFLRFTPKDSIILLLIPLLFFIKIPYVVPLTVGIVCTPASIVSVSFGVILFFLLNYISGNMSEIMSVSSDGVTMMTKLATEVFSSRELYLTIVAFALVILVVYFIKKMSIDYSWTIAIIVGAILCVIIMLIGAMMFDMSEIVSVESIIIGNIVSLIIAYLIKYMIHSVDYSRTEFTQFEDDDFYYYVKAVPKLKVTKSHVSVKRINARKVKKK